MYKVIVNDKAPISIHFKDGAAFLNDKNADIDMQHVGNNLFHILQNNQSYNAEIISVNADEKILSVRINNNVYSVSVKDRFDILLQQMGMNSASAKKANDLKAPMPGLVFKINVTEGQVVKKGDNLMILEAMKMENILKAAGDGIIKSIKVNLKDAVEKGQLLMQIE
jgi:biotin carboxyl carrier protein